VRRAAGHGKTHQMRSGKSLPRQWGKVPCPGPAKNGDPAGDRGIRPGAGFRRSPLHDRRADGARRWQNRPTQVELAFVGRLFPDPKRLGKSLSNEGHGFSRAVNGLHKNTTPLAPRMKRKYNSPNSCNQTKANRSDAVQITFRTRGMGL